MATIIDSLKVMLGLDSSDFEKGAKKVNADLKKTGSEADAAGNKLKDSGKKGADGFGNMAASATKFLAVIGGTMVIKRFVEQTIESSAALDRLSKNMGVSVEQISSLSNAAEVAGGSAEGMKNSLDMLSRAQTELMLTGQSSLIPYFSALGVAMSDAEGHARPVNDLLIDIGQALLAKSPDRKTAYNLGRSMGIDGDTLNLILRSRKEVELLLKQQKEYADTMAKLAPEGGRLQKSIIEVKQSFSLFALELLSRAIPALEKGLAIIGDLTNWMRDNKEFVVAFLTATAVGLGAIVAATIPINGTVVAIVALSAAIAALWDDYSVWKNGGDSFIGEKWGPGIAAATKGIQWLKDLLGDVIYRTIAAADAMAGLFNRDWARVKFATKEFMAGTGKTYGEEPPPGAKEAPADPNRERRAMQFFQDQGWTKEQSAGLVANIKRESEYNPNAVGDNGKAYGIAQWHPDRQADFKKQFGKDIKSATFDEQLAFMQYELTVGKEKSAGAKLRQTATAQDAAAAVSDNYERPADKPKEAAKRAQLASAIIGTGSPTPSPLSPIPGASMAAQGAGAGASSSAILPAPVAGATSTVSTTIGEVKVYTAATDANGIAADMGKGLDFLFTSQANYGLN